MKFNCKPTINNNRGAVGCYDTIRYEMLFNVRSKADLSQLNLPHGNDNKKCKTEKLKSKNGYAQK